MLSAQPFVTRLRHWLCNRANFFGPIKVPVQGTQMLSPELGNRYAATRVFHAGRRHRGGLVACGARAAAGEKQQGPAVPTYESTVRDPAASGLGVAVVSKPSCEVKS
jgi:hypothetical protein